MTVSLTPTSNSLDTSWCPRIQLNPDTIYLEMTSDSTVQCPVLWDYPSAPLQKPVASLGCYLYFWPTDCKSEVPTAPSLSSINLLEQFTELRETFYLLNHWFIMKRCKSGTARWERYKVWWKGGWASMSSSVHCPPQTSTCSPTWKLSEPHPFEVLWMLYYTDTVD